MEGVLVPLVFFAFLGAIIIVPQVLKSRDRQRMFDTMRAAYEKGQPVPPELVEAMTRRGGRDMETIDLAVESSHSRDLRRGVVWTAVGVGFLLLGAILYVSLYSYGGSVETFTTFAALGVIPLCIGLAFLALWFFGRDKSAR